jgi:predicted transcriptional regulator
MENKRQTACIFWIRDLANATPELNSDGFRVFSVGGKIARRVNVIAAVIDSYDNLEKRYSSITLDDSSGQIKVKAWDEDTAIVGDTKIGDMVLVVGLLHESKGEVFLRPEIARKVETSWVVARKKYLETTYGKKEAELFKVSEEIIDEAVEPTMEARGKIISMISAANDGMINVEELMINSGMHERLVEKILEELIKDGEIFRPKAGFVQAI